MSREGCLGLAFCLAYASTFGALFAYGQPGSAPVDPPEPPQTLRITIQTNPWGDQSSVQQVQTVPSPLAPPQNTGGSSVFTVPGGQQNRQNEAASGNLGNTQAIESQQNARPNQVEPFSIDFRNNQNQLSGPWVRLQSPTSRQSETIIGNQNQATLIQQQQEREQQLQQQRLQQQRLQQQQLQLQQQQQEREQQLQQQRLQQQRLQQQQLQLQQQQQEREQQLQQQQLQRQQRLQQQQLQLQQQLLLQNQQQQQQQTQQQPQQNTPPPNPPQANPSILQPSVQQGSSQTISGSPPIPLQNMQKLAGPIDIWGALTGASRQNPTQLSEQMENPFSVFQSLMNQQFNRQWSVLPGMSGQIDQQTQSSSQRGTSPPENQFPATNVDNPTQQQVSQPGSPLQNSAQSPENQARQPQPATQAPSDQLAQPATQPPTQAPMEATTQGPWQPPKPFQTPQSARQPTQQQQISPPVQNPIGTQRNTLSTQTQQQGRGQLIRSRQLMRNGEMGEINPLSQQFLGMAGNPLAWQMVNEFQQDFPMPWYLRQQYMGGNSNSMPQGGLFGSGMRGPAMSSGFPGQSSQGPAQELTTLPPPPPRTPSAAQRQQLALMMAMRANYERSCNQPLAIPGPMSLAGEMAPPGGGSPGEPMACNCYPRQECESVQFMYINPQTTRECGSRLTGYVCCCENARPGTVP